MGAYGCVWPGECSMDNCDKVPALIREHGWHRLKLVLPAFGCSRGSPWWAGTRTGAAWLLWVGKGHVCEAVSCSQEVLAEQRLPGSARASALCSPQASVLLPWVCKAGQTEVTGLMQAFKSSLLSPTAVVKYFLPRVQLWWFVLWARGSSDMATEDCMKCIRGSFVSAAMQEHNSDC